MAKINAADLLASLNKQNSNSNERNYPEVGFFSLKKDGDEAVVRIIMDTVEDMDILSVHQVEAVSNSGKTYYPEISCKKEHFYDDKCTCPLCSCDNEKFAKATTRLYLKMLHYYKEPDGTITAKAEVWTRSYQWVQKMQAYLENYGSLTDMVCKIIRHGVGLQTEYEVVPNLSPKIYTEENFPKKVEMFDNYKIEGNLVRTLNNTEIKNFLETGSIVRMEEGSEPAVKYDENKGFVNIPDGIEDDDKPIDWSVAEKKVVNEEPKQSMPWDKPANQPSGRLY